ncbi:MAG: glycosyltransferase family 9 protein [Betaproteobacteria bacterium]
MNRVLIVRLGALGDIVHGIPVAAALRRGYPDARIDWLVSAKHRAVLDLVPVVDRRLALGPGGALFDAVRELRRANYDVALDLQGLLKSSILARASGAKRVIGFGSRSAREPLARLFYTEAHDPVGRAAPSGAAGAGSSGPSRGLYGPAGRSLHVIYQNLSLLEPLGVMAREPEFPIEAVDSAVARRIVEETGGRYALLNPGAGWPNKQWPPERFGAVAAALRERRGLTSVVLWGPGEDALAAEVAAHSGGAARVSPATTIADLVALARAASLMISGDTGPAHLAAAVGTPIVGLYGPTWPARNGPWSPDDVVLSRAEICRCHHRRRCRLPVRCLLDVQVAETLAAVERRLAAVERGAPAGRSQ